MEETLEEELQSSPLEPLKKNFRRFLFRSYHLLLNGYTSFIIIAIGIGIASGLLNFIFVESYELLYNRVVIPFWGLPLVVLPLVSGSLILVVLSFIFPDILGYGFPRFLERVNLRGGIISPKETLAKAIGSCVTLGFGGSAGQEGPIAQIGGAVGSIFGQVLKVPRNKIRVLVACGVAAGIAATFNAPIAGVLFAEEIALLRDFKIVSFVPIVIASAVGTITSRMLRGGEPIFEVPPYQLLAYKELFFYALFGIISGILAAGFIKLFYGVKDSIGELRLPNYTKPIIGGISVALIGVFFPYVLGNGYEHVEKALLGELPFWIALGLIVLKPLATSLTIGSGWPGGIFAPSIFIGAMIGNTFGHMVESVFTNSVNLSSAYATVGMGTFLAAITQAPLTSIFLIFEVTQNYQVVIPIMISSVLGSIVTQILVGGSLESIELRRMGLNLEEEPEVNLLKSIRVRDVMNPKVESIPENMTLRKLIEYIPKSRYTTFPVVDQKGLLVGIISVQDLREWLFEESLKDLVVVKEVATLSVLTVTPDETMDVVLKKWSKKPVEILPVVESSGSKKIVGILSRKAIITAYNRAISGEPIEVRV